jgi:hypothetical protein
MKQGATKQKIEGMYQRAMDLRDRTPNPPNINWEQLDAAETQYTSAYLHAYRTGNVGEFVNATRKYRQVIRHGRSRPRPPSMVGSRTR